MNTITIPGRIPSKKNSKQIRKTPKGKTIVASSENYLDREKVAKMIARNQFGFGTISTPITISYAFYFPDKRKADISNKVESVNDMLVAAGILKDDDRTVIRRIVATSMGVDTANPRVEIEFIYQGG